MSAQVVQLQDTHPQSDVQRAFRAHVFEVLGCSFSDQTTFETSAPGEYKHATPVGDEKANKFWYRLTLHPIPRAIFGHYIRDGGIELHEWLPTQIDALSPEQLAAMEEAKQNDRQALKTHRVEHERIRASEIYSELQYAEVLPADFRYLATKGIRGLPPEIRLTIHRFRREAPNPFSGRWLEQRGAPEPAMMIPLHHVGGDRLVSAEYVAADGKKDYAYGLPASGAVFTFGDFDLSKPIYLCEGIATAATVFALTGSTTIRCGGATFLKRVAGDVRKRYGAEARIIVCAERGNGFAQAEEAAASASGALCTPPFSDTESGTDFNDYWQQHGDDATRSALLNTYRTDAAPASGALSERISAFVSEVNEEYFVAGRWGNEAAIGRDGNGHFSRVSNDSLRIHLASRRIPGVNRPPHLLWIEHPHRRVYREVAYDPDCTRLDSKNDRNLWTGFAVEAVPGDWSLLKKHLRDNVSNGSERVFDWLVGWMASIVQNPGRPCGVALVLRGDEGVGKGALFNSLLQLFGRHGRHFNRSDQLAGQFTGHFEGVSFVFCDEVGWAGDHELRDSLKAYITEPRIQIHPKGRTPYEVANTLNFGFATNKNHAVSITGGNRRFCVLDVRDRWAHLGGEAKADARRAYFTPLFDQLSTGGYSAMLYDLRRLDLTDFKIASFPRTSAMNEQVELSLGSLDSWITSLLRDGTRRTDSSTPLPWDDGAQIDKNELYADYLAFARAQGDRYPTKQAPFWKRLRQVTACDLPHEQVTDKVSGVRRRVIRLPPLDATRRNAARVLGLPELADDCTSENE